MLSQEQLKAISSCIDSTQELKREIQSLPTLNIKRTETAINLLDKVYNILVDALQMGVQ